MDLTYLIPLSGVVALIFVFIKNHWVSKKPVGNPKMEKIAKHISDGAMAFLKAEYKILSVFVICTAALLAFKGINEGNIGNYDNGWLVAVSFIVGALCSGLAGFIGMKVATRANVRTTNAAQDSLGKALEIAFSGGSVMGMGVVGLGVLGIGSLFIIYRPMFDDINTIIQVISGFSLGASSIALFARVGGGIYTKAADVGADLVGKVEAGIPEDHPLNPATIADNVGDNVGDVAGRGADLFESMTAENIGAMIIGATLYVLTGNFFFLIFPLLARAIGIFGTIIGAPFVRGKNFSDPMVPLRNGMIVTTIFVVIALYFLTTVTLGSIQLYYAALSGVIASIVIFLITEYYTSIKYRPVKEITDSSESGPAINVISGFSVGLESTALPVIAIVITILVGFFFGQ